MTFQDAFQNMTQAIKVNAEDPTLGVDVRHYANTVYMTMQAIENLIEQQEAEEVDALIEFFNQH